MSMQTILKQFDSEDIAVRWGVSLVRVTQRWGIYPFWALSEFEPFFPVLRTWETRTTKILNASLLVHPITYDAETALNSNCQSTICTAIHRVEGNSSSGRQKVWAPSRAPPGKCAAHHTCVCALVSADVGQFFPCFDSSGVHELDMRYGE